MASKPPVTPESLAQRRVEPDPIPPVGEVDARAADDATVAAFASEMVDGGSTVNVGFDVPESPEAPAVISRVDRVLAQAAPRGIPATDRPAARNYANEAYVAEDVESDGQVLDMMAANVAGMRMVEPADPGWWREFQMGESVEIGKDMDGNTLYKSQGMLDYEVFMHQPMVIRIHKTKDKNESPLVYVGVNGDTRWLPRGTNIRVPRKLVERLAQAQEMSFKTVENPDPTVDRVMDIVRNVAASYEFSVLHDPSPMGRRWLRRVTREGS